MRESASGRNGVGIKIDTKFVTFASLLQLLMREESPHLNEMKLRCRNTAVYHGGVDEFRTAKEARLRS